MGRMALAAAPFDELAVPVDVAVGFALKTSSDIEALFMLKVMF